MNWTAVRLGAGLSKAVQLAALTLAGGLLAAGCRAGGGGGGGGDTTGISETDEHGNLPIAATLITPGGKSDGANVKGQINYPGDLDWFKFRGIEGVGYVLQITGFPLDPDVRPDLDLTNEGTRQLVPVILNVRGTAQMESTSGTEAGDFPLDIPPAGEDGSADIYLFRDSRHVWIAPTTNAEYYFVIAHEREQTGIGAYEIRVASSQVSTVFVDDSIFQTGRRDVFLADDSGVWFDGWMAGGLQFDRFEFLEGFGFRVGFSFIISNLVFRPGNPNPEPVVVHWHDGNPNNFVQENSDANFIVDHPRWAEVQFAFGRGARSPGDVVEATGTKTLADGTAVRFPVDARIVATPPGAPAGAMAVEATLALPDDPGRGGEIDFGPSEIRNVTGLDWYMDLHPQPDVEDLDPFPVATSRPFGDVYQMFETHFPATEDNVLREDGSRIPVTERGNPPFIVYYDAALKLFQVATQEYQVDLFGGDPYQPFFLNPDYSSYVGDRVRVHAGGAGEVGPVIIDLGTLPAIAGPPTARGPNFFATVDEEPGFRAPIRQLTDGEALELRETYYDTGFYVEVTDRFTGEPLVRAESELFEISFFDELEPCSFPPCSGFEPATEKSEGTVTFASGLAGEGPIEVYVNGELLGSLARTVTADDLPACELAGDDRAVATALWPETYYWHAHAANGKSWDGHVTVPSGACAMVVISPDDEKLD